MPTFLDVAHEKVPESLQIDGRSFLPQLQGKKGNPRDWIYSWFLFPPNGGPKVFARNQQFKLYDDGKFYDISKDVLEDNPIPEKDLDVKTKKIYHDLKDVLDTYATRRLDAIPNNSGQ
ncbi:MAG: hypothetical protein VXW38_15125, partial [Bacteroidota bacterium]|nr:hypothetical protein [Bacteroidota bacterium]